MELGVSIDECEAWTSSYFTVMLHGGNKVMYAAISNGILQDVKCTNICMLYAGIAGFTWL